MFLLEFFRWYIKLVFGILIFTSCFIIIFGIFGVCKSTFKKLLYKNNQEIEDTEIIVAGGLITAFLYFLKFLVYKLFGIEKSIFGILETISNIIKPIPIWAGLLGGFCIIVIFSLIGVIREGREEKEYEKRKEEKRITEQKDINKYIKKIKTLNFENEKIKDEINKLVENLERLKEKDKISGNKKGGEFTGRYLPILMETLSGAEKVKLTDKEINNIVGTIATINAAIDKIIEQSEEPMLEDINATTMALTQVLKLKFKEQEDFK